MAQAYDPNDPRNMGEEIMKGIPGYAILEKLKAAGQAIPEAWGQAKQFLGITPPPPKAPPPGPMNTPRDAQGRPVPINPATGAPFTPQELAQQQAGAQTQQGIRY